jgi:hypothetical protein
LFGGTVASAVLGGLGSVAGGGKFADGAVTAAFGYLFNHFVHRGRNVVNPWDVGNDAHRTFQEYAAQKPDVFTESGYDDYGTFFPGRVDVGNSYARELWEIKPDNPVGLVLGASDVGFYVFGQQNLVPGSNLAPYMPGGASILPGGPLAGDYGWYSYRLGAPGVILYDFAPYRTTLALDFATYFGMRTVTQGKLCQCR